MIFSLVAFLYVRPSVIPGAVLALQITASHPFLHRTGI